MEQMAEPPPAPMHYLSPKLEARPAPNKGGMGVYACEPIRRGEVVAMWGGRVIPVEEIYYYNEELRRYLIQVEEGLFLTPSWPTEPAEYFNHSCDPNTGLSGQSALVAMRDIEPGEEVCFDYAMSESHPLFEFDCHCGSPLCRGRTSAEDWCKRKIAVDGVRHVFVGAGLVPARGPLAVSSKPLAVAGTKFLREPVRGRP